MREAIVCSFLVGKDSSRLPFRKPAAGKIPTSEQHLAMAVARYLLGVFGVN
jgi:hypothetical protein